MLHLFNTVHNTIFMGTHLFQNQLLATWNLRKKVRNCFLSDGPIAKYLNQTPGDIPRRMNGEMHVRTEVSNSDTSHDGSQACVTIYQQYKVWSSSCLQQPMDRAGNCPDGCSHNLAMPFFFTLPPFLCVVKTSAPVICLPPGILNFCLYQRFNFLFLEQTALPLHLEN